MERQHLSDAYIEYPERIITELLADLDSYVAGNARVGRRAHGEWIDITDTRMAQIRREVAGFTNAIARHKEYMKPSA
jgi:hypothetical protein